MVGCCVFLSPVDYAITKLDEGPSMILYWIRVMVLLGQL